EGKRLLMGGLSDEQAKVWDSKTDELLSSKQAGPGPVAFRSDGTPLQLIADSQDRLTLLLWDVSNQQLLRSFNFPAKPAQEPLLALSPDGVFVAASTTLSDRKGLLVVWDALTGALLHQCTKKATALAFSPDGKYLASGDADGQITTWNLPQREQLGTLSAGRMDIRSLA